MQGFRRLILTLTCCGMDWRTCFTKSSARRGAGFRVSGRGGCSSFRCVNVTMVSITEFEGINRTLLRIRATKMQTTSVSVLLVLASSSSLLLLCYRCWRCRRLYRLLWMDLANGIQCISNTNITWYEAQFVWRNSCTPEHWGSKECRWCQYEGLSCNFLWHAGTDIEKPGLYTVTNVWVAGYGLIHKTDWRCDLILNSKRTCINKQVMVKAMNYSSILNEWDV